MFEVCDRRIYLKTVVHVGGASMGSYGKIMETFSSSMNQLNQVDKHENHKLMFE